MITRALVGGWLLCAGALAAAAASRSASAADGALIAQGHAAFEYHCAACHGAEVISGNRQLPGTTALKVKYHGTEPGLLEKRTDLSPAVVKYFVRHGVSVMPFFRKTMVSDVELNAIAAYLARNYHSSDGPSVGSSGSGK